MASSGRGALFSLGDPLTREPFLTVADLMVLAVLAVALCVLWEVL